ncbi:MAG: hypothetical protein ABEK50_14880 [bacterium]
MLHLWLFPLLDWCFLPFLYLWNSISLTAVSVLAGIILIVVYYLTSDQWGLAYYKQQLKEHQNRLLHGDYSLSNIGGLLMDNVHLSKYGFIPAIFTVIPIVILIPWIGARFGLRTIQVGEPFEVTVRSQEEFKLRIPNDMRIGTKKRTFEAGKVKVRLLAETPGSKQLSVDPVGSNSQTIPISVDDPWGNAWPSLAQKKWYHHVLVPGVTVFPTDQPVKSVYVGYTENFRMLSLNIPGMARLPGWLNYFFLVSFVSGLAIKWHYSIE